MAPLLGGIDQAFQFIQEYTGGESWYFSGIHIGIVLEKNI
jgi:hypothetical protein